MNKFNCIVHKDTISTAVRNRNSTLKTKDDLEAELTHCKQLIAENEQVPNLSCNPKIGDSLHLLEDTVADDTEQLRSSTDSDAQTGHKSADTPFFDYKTHLAMSVERLVTTAIVTTVDKNDEILLQSLIEKNQAHGIRVNTIIGDNAYSEKETL